jgi:hypothetical protein
MADPVILAVESEALEIAEAIQSVFRADADLSFVDDSDIYIFRDSMEIEALGMFPFVIINLDTCKITNADNQDIHDVERHKYPVQLLFSNRSVNRDDIIRGDLISTDGVLSGFYGLFDIHDVIRSVFHKDPTFGKVVKSGPYQSDFTTEVSYMQEGQYYIGRAQMVFEVYKDVLI